MPRLDDLVSTWVAAKAFDREAAGQKNAGNWKEGLEVWDDKFQGGPQGEVVHVPIAAEAVSWTLTYQYRDFSARAEAWGFADSGQL